MICKSHPELSITSLVYSKDAALTWFAPLSGLPWAMILRSAAENHPDNRFDIVVADPLATIESESGTNTITYANGEVKTNTADPFAEVQSLQQQLLPALSPIDDLPFIGGALGYLSYDLGRQVEQIATLAEHDIPLPDLALGIYDWALIVDHKKQTVTLVEPKNGQRKAWLEQHQAAFTHAQIVNRANNCS